MALVAIGPAVGVCGTEKIYKHDIYIYIYRHVLLQLRRDQAHTRGAGPRPAIAARHACVFMSKAVSNACSLDVPQLCTTACPCRCCLHMRRLQKNRQKANNLSGFGIHHDLQTKPEEKTHKKTTTVLLYSLTARIEPCV